MKIFWNFCLRVFNYARQNYGANYTVEYSGYLKVIFLSMMCASKSKICVYSNCADTKVKEGEYAQPDVSLVGSHSCIRLLGQIPHKTVDLKWHHVR